MARTSRLVKPKPILQPFHDPLNPGPCEDDFEFVDRERSRFASEQEYQEYLDRLPKGQLKVDPKLARVETPLRLAQRTVEGYQKLAEQHGFGSGQMLMRVVLESYLRAHLPDEE
jgi:hypothetical protein